jgi:hypothetical protein
MKTDKKKHKIEALCDALGIKIGTLISKTGVSNSTIRMGILRNSEISADTAIKICEAYPQVNFNWLVKDEGEMFLTTTEVRENDEPYGKKHNLLDKADEIYDKLLVKLVGRKMPDKKFLQAKKELDKLKDSVDNLRQLLDADPPKKDKQQ